MDKETTAFFEDLQRMQIRVEQDGMESLQKAPRVWVKGTVSVGDRVYEEVGIHLKGGGTFQPINEKPSLTLKFNQFVDGQRLNGLRKLTLEYKKHDKSYLSEYVGNRLFAQAGLPAPRVGFAEVKLNDRDLGLYVMIEGITKDFLGCWFNDVEGNLYEGHQRDLDGGLDQDGGNTEDGQSDVEALVQVMLNSRPSDLMVRLQGHVDLEQFISFLAMETLLVHVDGYGQATSNYRIYHVEGKGFVFLPDGLDFLFSDPGAEVPPTMKGVLASKVLAVPEAREEYLARLSVLHRTVLQPDRIKMWMDERAPSIQSVLQHQPDEAAKQSREARNLLLRIEQRKAAVVRMLGELK